MVNAVLDYILLLDRLVIKLLVYVAEHDYYVYLWIFGPLLIGIVRPLFNIIDNKFQSIQNDILKNYAKTKLFDKYYNIDEFLKVMNDSGYTCEEMKEAVNEYIIEKRE